MTKMSQMTICRRICIFLILVAHHLLNAAESTRETCYRKTDSELATSGYCSSSCITGSFGPSANSKCKNSEKCCVPKLKTKVGSIVWNFFCLGGGGDGQFVAEEEGGGRSARKCVIEKYINVVCCVGRVEIQIEI